MKLFPLLTLVESQTLENNLLGNDLERIRSILQVVGKKLAKGIENTLRMHGPIVQEPEILILCGKGHNTADALWAGFYFCQKYPEARLTLLFANDLEDVKPLVKEALEACKPFVRRIVRWQSETSWLKDLKNIDDISGFDVVLDGIFGLQARDPLPDAVLEILRWSNHSEDIRLRIAVDLPTGLGGEECFRADFTFMMGTPKEICFREASRRWVGNLRFLDIGFFRNQEPPQGSVCVTSDILPLLFSPRSPLTHKYQQGVLGVIGSSEKYPGAGFLATKAAVPSGVGLVYSWVPENLIPAFAAELPEVIWRSQSQKSLQEDILTLALDALVVGPGLYLTKDLFHFLENIVSALPCPVIWDASLLNENLLSILKARGDRGFLNILTPHPGEWKRLTGCTLDADEVSDSALKAFAKKMHSVVVLKQNRLRVMTEDRIYHLLGGNPILARGGTGDILAGLLGGVIASPLGHVSYEKGTQMSKDQLLVHLILGSMWYLSASDAWAMEYSSRGTHTSQMLNFL